MKLPYPELPKDQFLFLVEQAERYTGSPQPPAERTIRQWRRRAVDWLKEHTANSELADSLLVVPPSNLHRALAVLLRARPIVPFLKEEAIGAVPKPKNSKKVFIVHGRDDALKNSVARVVSRIGMEPIILHEQPNRGRTIIEKFLDHSDVAYAVVLLTPDDKGGLIDGSFDSMKARARQNVILELGFFIGRLGRERVAALFDATVDMPSDYTGVLYIPYDDSGVWSLHLAKEMKAVGLSVDLNKL
ncbi:MAG: nucleotide-binding protein [Verrucomicrobia bacterium]|nr:nucleotide-binding protein [Verrucomicrobiota bacterium]